jgi:hypothetical protein
MVKQSLFETYSSHGSNCIAFLNYYKHIRELNKVISPACVSFLSDCTSRSYVHRTAPFLVTNILISTELSGQATRPEKENLLSTLFV